METPTDVREAMRAGMEGLLAAMKDRGPAPIGAASGAEATPLPNGDEDPLAAASLGAIDWPSFDEPDRSTLALSRVLERGTIVGRHVVLQKLGAGGMGVVYAAYDPELDRKVALKLLRPGAGGEQARVRLQREAQALAKLAHPNVVGIHDVGTIDDQVWLAMEFVQGQTLTAWLRAPRRWREVLGVMRSAGEGLVAAHGVGLLHRDFKPDNVMVGDDGRVRVMDFGLARARPEQVSLHAERSQPLPALEALALQITQAGALVGTPSYMAPEQLEGRELTAAADQFAFCVTLWEALYGERPFGGRSLVELLANVLAGRRRPARKGSAVPSRLRRACERGLSLDPRLRWPSMDALLSELQGLGAPRRWLALGLAGGLTAMGAGVAWYAEIGLRCQGARAELEGVWDETRRQEVEAAILGTGLPHAHDTWDRARTQLDWYADAWANKFTEMCEATSVRQERSQEAMALGMECLEEQRLTLGEAVRTLLDPTRVDEGMELVAELPHLERCDHVRALKGRRPPPQIHEVNDTRALWARMNRISRLRGTGAYTEALAEAEVTVAEAERVGYVPVLVDALSQRAAVHESMDQYAEAEQDLERAYLSSLELGDAREAHWAARRLVRLLGHDEARLDDVLQWGKAAVALGRNVQNEPTDEASALHDVGYVLGRRRKLEEALDHHRRGLTIREEALGPRHTSVASSLDLVADVLETQGALDEALDHYRRALAIWEQRLGPYHTKVATTLHTMGHLLHRLGRHEEAFDYHGRALTIREAALGPRHLDVAAWLECGGHRLRERGRLEEALDYHGRALTIREAALGPRHPGLASSLGHVGHVLLEQGELVEAQSLFERALAIREEALGPRHPDLAYSLLGLAEVALARNDAVAARELAERAVSLREESVASPDLLAKAWFVLARALWSGDSQRVRARALAERARDAYTHLGHGSHEELAEVATWLAEHVGEG